MGEKQMENSVAVYLSTKLTAGETQCTRSLQGCTILPALRELTF